MAAWIELRQKSRMIGSFDLPATFRGVRKCMFRLGRKACGGGNGVVFESEVLGGIGIQRCAIKVLKQQDEVRCDRFENEVRIQSTLKHSQIAALYDNGFFAIEAFEVPWMAMELGGRNLWKQVEYSGVFSRENLLLASMDICGALQHLHEQEIIHRDIKPQNFVMDLQNDGRLKMIDFGIAKYLNEDISGRPLDQFTQEGDFVGPVFFASPELVAYAQDKKHPVDYRSDIFQAGKLIWYLATGKITAGIPSKKDCPVGGQLRNLLVDVLSDDPDDRPQTVVDLANELQSVLS